MSSNIACEIQRTGHVATVYDGSLFLWGGYKESEDDFYEKYYNGSEIVQYEPLYEKWFCRKCNGTIPPGTSGSSAVLDNNLLYCFGGYRTEGNTSDLYCLNLDTFTWRFILPNGSPPVPCDKSVAWKHKNRLFFFGGFGVQPDPSIKRPQDFSYVVDMQSPAEYRRGWNNQLVCFNTSEEKWSIPLYKGNVPVARAAHACAKVKNKVFIMGGRHLDRRMNDLHCFDTETLQWSGEIKACGVQPARRSWHSLTALTEETLLLYGGFSQDNTPLSDCWLLCLPAMTWIQLDLPLTRPRLWHTASMLTPGEVFICGGCSQNILSHNPVHDHEVELIVLRFSPKSLLRTCLDNIVTLSLALLKSHGDTLPKFIQDILQMRVADSATKSLIGSELHSS